MDIRSGQMRARKINFGCSARSRRLRKDTPPDVRKVHGMEQAIPQPRPERPWPPAASLARCAPAFALALETFLIGCHDCPRVANGNLASRHRWQRRRSTTEPRFECTRNHYRRAAPFRMDKNRRGVLRSTLTGAIHRSTHSTNAGGISFRTIMTRKIRSSRNSVAMPTRAAPMVG